MFSLYLQLFGNDQDSEEIEPFSVRLRQKVDDFDRNFSKEPKPFQLLFSTLFFTWSGAIVSGVWLTCKPRPNYIHGPTLYGTILKPWSISVACSALVGLGAGLVYSEMNKNKKAVELVEKD